MRYQGEAEAGYKRKGLMIGMKNWTVGTRGVHSL